MSRARLIVRTSKITPVTLESVQESEPEVHGRRNSIEPGHVGWDVAVDAARFLLDETFGSPEATHNPILTDTAQELAALLCAYDVVVDAVEHMQAYRPAPPDHL